MILSKSYLVRTNHLLCLLIDSQYEGDLWFRKALEEGNHSALSVCFAALYDDVIPISLILDFGSNNCSWTKLQIHSLKSPDRLFQKRLLPSNGLLNQKSNARVLLKL